VACLAILQIYISTCTTQHTAEKTQLVNVVLEFDDFEDSAAICTIQKGGLRYIDEWVDYHLAIGFEKIYIYDNSDDFELKQWYNTKREQQQNSNSTVTVVVKHFPGPVQQQPSIMDCGISIQNARSHSWIAFIDLDEYIVLKKHKYILDLLHTVDKKKAGGLALNWLLFDFNNHLKYKPLPMTKRFQRAALSADQHVKTIVRTDQLRSHCGNPHGFIYIDEKLTGVDTDGKQLDPQYFNIGGPTDVAVIHHYYSKSIEEFASRCNRGRADIRIEEIKKEVELYCKNETEIFNSFTSSTNPTAFDDSAWVLLKERVPHYAKYDKVKD